MQVVLFGKHAGTDGPSRVTRGMASGLAEKGLDVTVLGYGQHTDVPHSSVQLELFSDIPDSVGEWRALYQAVQKRVTEVNPDIFHALERYPYESDLRTVQWTSDMVVMWKKTGDRPGTRALIGEAILNWYSRQGVRKATMTVAQSPETVSQMQRLWKSTPDTIIPLGIAGSSLTRPVEVSQPSKILVVGRISQRKGQRQFLDHLDPSSAQYDLQIIGGKADEEYAAEALDGWKEQYRGYVAEKELRAAYEQGDIVVVPSHLENFSVVALEAIANGCAVVITDDCGFAQFDWADESNGIFVASGRAEAAIMTEQIAKSNPDELLRYKRSAFELAQRLTWDHIVERYIGLYNSC